jgi:divalent metal cation (Fe/Co/Zn/Cd) transporter
LVVDGAASLGHAHELASAFEQRVRGEIPRLAEIITHIEPVSDSSERTGPWSIEAHDVTGRARQLVEEWYEHGACHDVQAYRLGDNWGITLHCTLDEDMALERAHEISSQIEIGLRDAIPRVGRVTVHTEPTSTA